MSELLFTMNDVKKAWDAGMDAMPSTPDQDRWGEFRKIMLYDMQSETEATIRELEKDTEIGRLRNRLSTIEDMI